MKKELIEPSMNVEKKYNKYCKEILCVLPSKKKVRTQKIKEQNDRRRMRELIKEEREYIDIIIDQSLEVARKLKKDEHYQDRLGKTSRG